MNELENTLTPQEVATLIGQDIRTIRDWISRGIIESIKVPGNRRRVPRSALVSLKATAPNPTAPNPRQTSISTLSMKRYLYGLEIPDNFDVITTYEELSQYTKAFAKRDITFLLLVGSPGSGKSYQLKSDVGPECVWIDNHATILGLYCSVYRADNSPIVLDDINHLFKSKMACSLMKALTQTENARSVSWESTSKILEEQKVPRKFETSSPICLIANQWNGTDPDMAAIQDRALPVAFYPSAETVHKRVLELGWCDDEICNFIGQHLSEIPQPSMREYYQAMTYRRAKMDWQGKLVKLWQKR